VSKTAGLGYAIKLFCISPPSSFPVPLLLFNFSFLSSFFRYNVSSICAYQRHDTYTLFICHLLARVTSTMCLSVSPPRHLHCWLVISPLEEYFQLIINDIDWMYADTIS
jgi:hypothetical protein